MPYNPNDPDDDDDDDTTTGNGTLRQWLNYRVLPYKIQGYWVVSGVVLIFFLIGLAL